MVTNSNLFKFAFFPSYDSAIEQLATLAKQETWAFSQAEESGGSYPILRNYLSYTFDNIKADSLIAYSAENKFACFNTGLVTESYEEIFAFFEKNRNVDAPTPYFFKQFCKRSYQKLHTSFQQLPDPVNYFKEPEKLIFSPKFDVDINPDHIIDDNIDRLPEGMRSCHHDEILDKLKGALSRTKMMVRSNYKLAVPQYFHGKIQLLLPMYLEYGLDRPSVALAVEKYNSRYLASTILTLRMAYNNARLIVRPESDWLSPE